MNVVHESTCPDIGPVCTLRDEPPQLHDQTMDVTELRALVEYGFDDVWAARLMFPVRLTRTAIVFRRLDGTPFVPELGNIHHRDEVLAGPGDPQVTASARWRSGNLTLLGRAGVSLPLGRTEENPFALGEEGRVHQHIQFGTGTFAPVFALEARWRRDATRLFGYAVGHVPLYDNAKGYRAGARLGAGLVAGVDQQG